MFNKKLKFYSILGNKLKNISKKLYQEKFIEEKSYSYLDSNGQKMKLKYELEREKRLFSEFINNMSNYQKIEENKKKDYFSKLRGYKNFFEEKKIAERRKKRFQDVLEFRKRNDLLNENKLRINFSELYSHNNNLIEERRNKIFNRNKIDIHKNEASKINPKPFLSINSSLNSENINNICKKFKLLETSSSNIMPNILRKRIHSNNSSNNLKEKNSQNISQKGNDVTNNELSFYSSLNLSNNTNINNNNDINSISNKKIKNIKSSINKYIFNQNNIRINVQKIHWKKKFKIKKPLILNKIKDKTINSFNGEEDGKVTSDRTYNDLFSLSNINDKGDVYLEKNKMPIKLKKLNSIRSKNIMNYIIYNFSNSISEEEREKEKK